MKNKLFFFALLLLLLIGCGEQSSGPSASEIEMPTPANNLFGGHADSTDEGGTGSDSSKIETPTPANKLFGTPTPSEGGTPSEAETPSGAGKPSKVGTPSEGVADEPAGGGSSVEVTVSNLHLSGVVVHFSKSVDPMTGSDEANYTINGRTPDQVSYNVAKRQAVLILDEGLERGGEYAIEVNNVKDLEGKIVRGAGEFSVSSASSQVAVDVEAEVHPISPYIYGMASPPVEYMKELGVTLHRWGGNANTRYNWKVGNAWNTASDWFYQNTDYKHGAGSVADEFARVNNELGVASLLTIPTIGWVAKDTSSCSFPLPDGTCGNAEGARCDNPGQIADPNATSVQAPPEFMVEWVVHLTQELGYEIPFFAMGNEPDISGVTHYDIHPECTGYDEIYERFVSYAAPIKEVAPQSEILGPISCCWWFYWNSMLGEPDKQAHDGMDFLPWFLTQMADYESETGQRLLDVFTIHYYPEGLYNDDISTEVAELRTRATRSLWDPNYPDESWINRPVSLIPRMKELIDTYYPDTKFGIGEWNWGADKTMNGAIAIADVLGIFGREDLYFASYWRYPEAQSPGYYAFKMYTNYDSAGSRFGDTSTQAKSSHWDTIGSYAAIDSQSGNLHVMLINKQPDQAETTEVTLAHFLPNKSATQYRYSVEPNGEQNQIMSSSIDVADKFQIELPPYSITLLVIEPEE
ncbi:MAG: glycoside hydrolase family 44 protein [Ardenticatenaceae bacterium]